jgi:hypothetical protein
MVIYSHYKLSSGQKCVLPCVVRIINPFEVCVPVIFERIDSDIYSLKKAQGNAKTVYSMSKYHANEI